MTKIRKIMIVFTAFLFGCSGGANTGNAAGGAAGNSKEVSSAERITLSLFTEDKKYEITEAEAEIFDTENGGDNAVTVKIRVKNHTDADVDQVSFYFYSYDSNGDKIADAYLYVDDLEAGQSAWARAIPIRTDYDHFGGIKLVNYEWYERKDGMLWGQDTIDFSERITIEKDKMNAVHSKSNNFKWN